MRRVPAELLGDCDPFIQIGIADRAHFLSRFLMSAARLATLRADPAFLPRALRFARPACRDKQTSFALEKINALIKTKTGSFEVLKNNVIAASRY